MRFQWLKWIGAPGSPGFLLVSVLAGLILYIFLPRLRRVVRIAFVLLAITYLLLSLPAVAHGLAASLGADETLPTSGYRPVRHLFLLDGDSATARGKLAADLNARSPVELVWIVGGGALKDAALAHGLPQNKWIWAGDPDRTTVGQIRHVTDLIRKMRLDTSGVIVSRVQAPRTRSLVSKTGMDLPVFASPVDHEPPTSGLWRWLPSLSGLTLSRDVIYEHVAVTYYRWKGWI